jgi:hypothetical protein
MKDRHLIVLENAIRRTFIHMYVYNMCNTYVLINIYVGFSFRNWDPLDNKDEYRLRGLAVSKQEDLSAMKSEWNGRHALQLWFDCDCVFVVYLALVIVNLIFSGLRLNWAWCQRKRTHFHRPGFRQDGRPPWWCQLSVVTAQSSHLSCVVGPKTKSYTRSTVIPG